jgi:hypothetical protein
MENYSHEVGPYCERGGFGPSGMRYWSVDQLKLIATIAQMEGSKVA